MDIGGDAFRHRGGVHVIPVADVPGTLVLCGLDAIGPDPAGLLTVVEGDLADPGGRVHDPVALGAALASVAP